MRNFTLSVLVVAVVVTGTRATASAQFLDPSNARCAGSFISTDKALRRYAWAHYCTTHVGQYAGGFPMESYKYLQAMNITLYNNDANPRKDNLYPAYYNFVGEGNTWDIPDSVLTTGVDPRAVPTSPAICRTTDEPGGLFPVSALNAGLCTAGCYVEGTPLQFVDGTMGIKAAAEAGKVDLVTLSPTATLDNLQFTNNKVERYVTDFVDTVQEIYTLSMKSGGQLRVTTEHPLLTSDGVIHQAQQLEIGDELVLASGKPDAIVGIELNKMFGKVYNVSPVSTDYVSNIVVAGGYLNGSLRFQNEFLGMINSLILRRALATVEIDRG